MSAQILLKFGFLAPKMARQLKAQGYRLPPRHCADDVNIAISTLCLGGFITERQRDQARRKLAQRVMRDMVPLRRAASHQTEVSDDTH